MHLLGVKNHIYNITIAITFSDQSLHGNVNTLLMLNFESICADYYRHGFFIVQLLYLPGLVDSIALPALIR